MIFSQHMFRVHVYAVKSVRALFQGIIRGLTLPSLTLVNIGLNGRLKGPVYLHMAEPNIYVEIQFTGQSLLKYGAVSFLTSQLPVMVPPAIPRGGVCSLLMYPQLAITYNRKITLFLHYIHCYQAYIVNIRNKSQPLIETFIAWFCVISKPTVHC